MSTTKLDEARQLANNGAFRLAKATLEAEYRTSHADQVPRDALLLEADLAEKTGDLREASYLIDRLRGSVLLDGRTLSALLLVEGSIARQRGHMEDASRAFAEAGASAKACSSTTLECWAELRLFSVREERAPGKPHSGHSDSIGSAILRTGDPTLNTAYQLQRAEYHAKHGALALSESHASLAASLLRRFPNLWLHGLLELHLCCVAYLTGNFFASLCHARSALAAANESGHHHTRCAALTNLGAAYLALGQVPRAERAVAVALQSVHPGTLLHALALETMAEVWLAVRHFPRCQALLSSARSVIESNSQELSAWHASWSQYTRLRLCQLSGLSPESGDDAKEPPLSPENSPAGQRSRLSQVAGLLQRGDVEEASRALTRLEQDSARLLPSYQGQLLALAARLYRATNRKEQAWHFHRVGLLVLSGAGETAEFVDCILDYCEVLGHCGHYSQAEKASPDWSCIGLRRALVVRSILNASTPLGKTSVAADCELGTLSGLTGQRVVHPEIFGELALRTLVSHNALRHGALTEKPEHQSERVIVSFGLESKSLTTLVTADKGLRVGGRHGNEYTLRLAATETIEAVRLARAVVQLLGLSDDEDTSRHTAPIRSTRNDADVGESGLIAVSPTMLGLLSYARRIAATDGGVLITGESGTGKEVLARFVHSTSGRRKGPFVPFNCSTLPRDLVDSQLFGYRRGAFTGAIESFDGIIRGAAGGTLFLDEVADLPLDVQPKLLRFLDTGEIQGLGERHTRLADVRVLAATNANVEQLVAEGRFRTDLYYRLNVFRLCIPPLRERRDDINALIDHYLEKFTRSLSKTVRLSHSARVHMVLSDWPGNVRQLASAIYRLVASTEDGEQIEADYLMNEPGRTLTTTDSGWEKSRSETTPVDLTTPLRLSLDRVERLAISRALAASGGNQAEAAKLLGLSRKGLYLKRLRLGL